MGRREDKVMTEAETSRDALKEEGELIVQGWECGFPFHTLELPTGFSLDETLAHWG